MSDVPELAKSISRLRSWINESGLTNIAIAAQAGVDEKLVRLVKKGAGNPTVDTLSKLESLIPSDWREGDPVPPSEAA
jgi:transcriptional regulator with XRE-family HTH domain